MEYPRFRKYMNRDYSKSRDVKQMEKKCEEWFRDRKGNIEEVNTNADNSVSWRRDLPSVEKNTVLMPKFTPPKSKCNVCNVCKCIPEKTYILNCTHEHCLKCTQFYEELENRCPTCRKSIHTHLFEIYDGCEALKIPSYKDFQYVHS